MNSNLIKDIEKIYSDKRKKALEKSEFLQEELLKDTEYLSTYNEYNSTRFEISKAKFLGDDNIVKSLKLKLKSLSNKLNEIKESYDIILTDLL